MKVNSMTSDGHSIKIQISCTVGIFQKDAKTLIFSRRFLREIGLNQ